MIAAVHIERVVCLNAVCLCVLVRPCVCLCVGTNGGAGAMA